MNETLTLVLDKNQGDLWLEFEGSHKLVLWDVTGLELDKTSILNRVKILRRGKQIGSAWDVKEIKVKW